MVQIPETTKAQLKQAGIRFNRDPKSEKVINQSLLVITKRAVGNTIEDTEPYTIRINFQNGRIVGSEAQPRLSVELLNGRASTPEIDTPKENTTVFLEFKTLAAEGYPPIVNGDSWVARTKIVNDKIKTVFVNRDFSEEDRKLIEAALLRGLLPQTQL